MANKAIANKRKYNDKYDKENMKTFSIKVRREVAAELEECIQKMNDDGMANKMNRNKFVTLAILEKLEKYKMNNDE